MPTKAQLREIERASRALAEQQLRPALNNAAGAIKQNEANRSEGQARIGGYLNAIASLVNKPQDYSGLTSAMNDLEKSKGAYATEEGGSSSARHRSELAQHFQNMITQRQGQIAGDQKLLGVRGQDMLADSERYYNAQRTQRQGALNSLRQQYGSTLASNAARMRDALSQREYQAQQAKLQRDFTARQNELSRQASQAQSQRQYDLAVASARENRRQFDKNLKENQWQARHGSKGDGQPAATAREASKASWIAQNLIPRWYKKFGSQFDGKKGHRTQSDFLDWMEQQGSQGFQLPDYLGGRYKDKDGKTQLTTYSFTPREFEMALRQRGSRR
jgi:hypothetical protein